MEFSFSRGVMIDPFWSSPHHGVCLSELRRVHKKDVPAKAGFLVCIRIVVRTVLSSLALTCLPLASGVVMIEPDVLWSF